MYLMQIVTMAKGLSEAAMSRRLHLLVAIQVATVNAHTFHFLLNKLCQNIFFKMVGYLFYSFLILQQAYPLKTIDAINNNTFCK